MDLTVLDPDDGMPWDFSIASKRDKARALRRKQQPYMLIGSPECTQFSQIQAINETRRIDPSAYRRARTAAIVHIDFMMELFREKLGDGHYFLYGHPRWATSWALPSVEAMMAVPRVGLTQGDQCQYGVESMSGGTWAVLSRSPQDP